LGACSCRLASKMQFSTAVAELLKAERYRRVHDAYKKRHLQLVSAAFTLILVAFLLQLLVAASLPVVRAVYLMSVSATTASELIPTLIATELRFGVWGYCGTSVLNPPTLFTNNGDCSPPQLGYNISTTILEVTGQPALAQDALEGLTLILILHPVCAVLCFATLAAALFARWHGFAVLALVLSIVTSLVTSVSAAIDIAVVAVAMNEIGLAGLQLEVGWGNAPWMTLAATILLWAAVIVLSAMVCGCCGVNREMWVSYQQPEKVFNAETN